MIRKQLGDIGWLEFELLQEIPELVHAVFLRNGGVSTTPYNSLNFGVKSGDSLEAVATNRALAAHILGLSNLVIAPLCHSDKIEVFSRASPLSPQGCDGLISKEEDIGLLVTHADCQAALFVDPIRRVVGNIHSGWRGSVQNIYQNVVSCFVDRFGSNPANLLVCISPSLGPMNAEFIHYQTELPPSFEEFQVRPTYFDFWEISRMQLKQAGVLSDHIQIANICTYEAREDFFSYRREKNTGRNGTIVGFKTLARILNNPL